MLWDHLKVGFLDEMLSIFDEHDHPVILVGHQAIRWMGVGVITDEVITQVELLIV